MDTQLLIYLAFACEINLQYSTFIFLHLLAFSNGEY